jgi:beta-lactamase regulating signal transducer with metallopeptidase domain
MITAAAFGVLPAVADSARVVEHVYAVSLSALAPLAIAGVATVALRRSQAASRSAVLRASVLAMLIICIGGLLPAHRVAWIVPTGFADPLIALGRMQVGAPIAKLLADQASGAEVLLVRWLFILYVVGVIGVLVSLVVATARLARHTRRATPVADRRVLDLFDQARTTTGVARPLGLFMSSDVRVPMTWGSIRPAILLPVGFRAESDDRLRAVFLHELRHVKSRDAAFMIASRICCALLWFNPIVWLVDRRLRSESEVACDDAVLALGVRQSDYAELLVDTCDRLCGHGAPQPAMTIAERSGMRERLRSIIDPARHLRRRSQLLATFSIGVMMLIALSASAVQLAPTRSVLDSLMRDGRWESRAYAVLGLAQRPDSIEVARSAATTDPDPKVRAWARYAVSLELVGAPATRSH